jgi:hypothetical protein
MMFDKKVEVSVPHLEGKTNVKANAKRGKIVCPNHGAKCGFVQLRALKAIK